LLKNQKQTYFSHLPLNKGTMKLKLKHKKYAIQIQSKLDYKNVNCLESV